MGASFSPGVLGMTRCGFNVMKTKMMAYNLLVLPAPHSVTRDSSITCAITYSGEKMLIAHDELQLRFDIH